MQRKHLENMRQIINVIHNINFGEQRLDEDTPDARVRSIIRTADSDVWTLVDKLDADPTKVLNQLIEYTSKAINQFTIYLDNEPHTVIALLPFINLIKAAEVALKTIKNSIQLEEEKQKQREISITNTIDLMIDLLEKQKSN